VDISPLANCAALTTLNWRGKIDDVIKQHMEDYQRRSSSKP